MVDSVAEYWLGKIFNKIEYEFSRLLNKLEDVNENLLNIYKELEIQNRVI